MKATVELVEEVTVNVTLVGTMAEVKELRDELGTLNVGQAWYLYDALDDAVKERNAR